MKRTHPVRVVTLEGNPWFVAADARRVLGLIQGGDNFASLAADEVRPIPRGLLTGKGSAKLVLLSESGLYKLIMRSDKPQARPFQDWVTREVLPSIRKTGSYELPKGEVMPIPVDFADVRAPQASERTTRMNALVPFNGTAERTMSSLDIAELTGKRHDNVCRDIRHMLEDLDVNHLKFEGVYRDAKGEERTCYRLPQRESLILATKYSTELRAKIIDRWMELEREARQPAPQPVLTTAQQLAQAVLLANTVIQQKDEKIALLETTVAEQKPLVRVTEARSVIHQRCDSILSD